MKRLSALMNLAGRVAVITGGAGHIGRAMGEALAEAGAAIAVVDLNADGAESFAARLRSEYGVAALAIGVDLSDEAQLRSIPATVIHQLARIDILVNNAALIGTTALKGWAVPFDQQDAGTWRKALEVNLTVPFLLTQCCRPHLENSGHGSIINIGSIYGVVGPDMRLYEQTALGNPAAYAASKGGLLQLTRWLATALAPAVRVNSIVLGGVFRDQPPAFVERYLARTPLGRMASEQDLKGSVAYLASDLSAYVTGHSLVVDGGWTAW